MGRWSTTFKLPRCHSMKLRSGLGGDDQASVVSISSTPISSTSSDVTLRRSARLQRPPSSVIEQLPLPEPDLFQIPRPPSTEFIPRKRAFVQIERIDSSESKRASEGTKDKVTPAPSKPKQKVPLAPSTRRSPARSIVPPPPPSESGSTVPSPRRSPARSTRRSPARSIVPPPPPSASGSTVPPPRPSPARSTRRSPARSIVPPVRFSPARSRVPPPPASASGSTVPPPRPSASGPPPPPSASGPPPPPSAQPSTSGSIDVEKYQNEFMRVFWETAYPIFLKLAEEDLNYRLLDEEMKELTTLRLENQELQERACVAAKEASRRQITVQHVDISDD